MASKVELSSLCRHKPSFALVYGTRERNRTFDLTDRNRALYPLSYAGKTKDWIENHRSLES